MDGRRLDYKKKRSVPSLFQASSHTVLLSPDLPGTSSISFLSVGARSFLFGLKKEGSAGCGIPAAQVLELRTQQSLYFKVLSGKH